jgi:hypothetical protein
MSAFVRLLLPLDDRVRALHGRGFCVTSHLDACPRHMIRFFVFLCDCVSAWKPPMSGRHDPIEESDPLRADTPTQPRPAQWRKRPAAEDYFDKDDRKRVDCRSETSKVNGQPGTFISSDPPVIDDRGQSAPSSAANVNNQPEPDINTFTKLEPRFLQTWIQPDVSENPAVNEEPINIHPNRFRANYRSMESNGQIRDVQLSPSSSSPPFMKNPMWISDDTRGKVPNCCQFFLSTPHTAVVIHIVMLLDVDDQHRFSASPSLHRSSRFQSSGARSYQHQTRARARAETDQNGK